VRNQSILWANSFTFSAGNLLFNQGASVTLGSLSLIMQGDGNLVLYQGGIAVWNSGTSGQDCGSGQCLAAFQGDGTSSSIVALPQFGKRKPTATPASHSHFRPSYPTSRSSQVTGRLFGMRTSVLA
jgi:hypothetical protein